jgi:hypothetical protein
MELSSREKPKIMQAGKNACLEIVFIKFLFL